MACRLLLSASTESFGSGRRILSGKKCTCRRPHQPGGQSPGAPAADCLAVVHGDRRLRVWNTSDRTAFVELQGGQLAVDLQIAWSANGRLLAGTGSD